MKGSAAILFLTLLFAISVLGYEKMWQKWKRRYDKSYTRAEGFYRRQTWIERLKYVQSHNKKFLEGKVSFRLKMNKFSDMGISELSSKFTRFYNFSGPVKKSVGKLEKTNLPKSVDWRKRKGKNCVSDVKDQGGPGSCFVFSAIGSLEGQYCKRKRQLTALSVQQILDCDRNNCGGYMEEIYAYLKKQKGVMSDSDYPYSACLDCMQCLVKDPFKTFVPRINRFLCDSRCRFSRKKIKTRVKSFVRLPSSEEELKRAVSKIGPVAVGIDARFDFPFYSGNNDIYYEPRCSSTRLNHAVLVVGYGTKDGKDYWIIKNSWGKDWGVHGYARMSRNRGNNCGIATAAVYPVI